LISKSSVYISSSYKAFSLLSLPHVDCACVYPQLALENSVFAFSSKPRGCHHFTFVN
jgi:hypothetical protein